MDSSHLSNDILPNLVLVASPYQLLCAIEYLSDMQLLEPTHVLFEIAENSVAEQQMFHLLNKFKLAHHTRLLITSSGTLRQRITRYVHQVKPFIGQSFQTILIGDIRKQWMQDTLCSLEAEKYIMVDDGAAVLSIYQHVLSKQGCALPVDLFPDGDSSRKEEAAKVKNELGLQIKTRRLGIFSLFNLPSPHYFKQHHFSNVLKVLAENKEVSKQSEVHFIGSHFVELGLLSEGEYFFYLERARALVPENMAMVYFPHRGECFDTKKRQLAALNIKFRELQCPYEMFLMQSFIVPAQLIGFYTTCLFNVNAIFTDNIETYYIKLRDKELRRFKGMDWMHQRFSLYDQVMSIYQQLDDDNIKKLF